MKIFCPVITKKSFNSPTKNTIKRILNSPKGPNLRSRKIKYEEDQIVEQSDDECQKDIEFNPNTKTIKRKKSQKQQETQKSKEKAHQIKSSQDQAQQQGESDCQEIYFDNEHENLNEFMAIVKKRKRQCRPVPLRKIFQTNQFNKIQEIDFHLYFKILAKAKMLSTLLINEFGQVIFADRLGSQHFEGSLNNFARNPIYSMILQSEQQKFLKKTSQLKDNELVVAKLLIYSKNSKRRYSKATNEISLTNQDLFNRYLKCISCSIQPVQITISSTEQFQGFWNRSLFNLNQPLKCFLVKSRLSKSLPDFSSFDLKRDKKIEKFLKYTRKKQAQKEETLVKKQNISEEQKSLVHFPIHQYFSDQFLNQNDIENFYSEMNEDIKHSKSTVTKSCVLNSGEGKQRHLRE